MYGRMGRVYLRSDTLRNGHRSGS